MKRPGSSDSLGCSMTICPNSEEKNPNNTHVYSREFQSMLDGLDEEGCIEELSHISEKKRRLSVEQVKALERNFEVENKLEPERKVKLAQELGLQTRQVAVWFQNRRARWKTKQLERDYGVLKANYDNLKLNFDSLQRDNETLLKEIKELKLNLNEGNRESNRAVKEEAIISEPENGIDEKSEPHFTPTNIDAASEAKESDHNSFDDVNGAGILIFPDLKDGSSDDSDSSAILNEDNGPNAVNSSSGFFQDRNHLVTSPTSSSIRFNCSSSCLNSTMNYFQFSNSKTLSSNAQKVYHQPQLIKNEEHNFFSGEEDCNFFSDELAPSLHWYCPDQWN